MTSTPEPSVERFDAHRAHRAEGLLAVFNEPGVLIGADVHVAQRLAVLLGESDDAILLAAALAVRAPRLGHVYVDLKTIHSTATVDSEQPVDLSELPWPAPDVWTAALEASGMVTVGEDDEEERRPLRLVGHHLYLDRYWREEVRIATELGAFSADPADDVDREALQAGISRLFPGKRAEGRQPAAAATAVLRRFTVVAGGPGTGKTTTVAAIAALLLDQARACERTVPMIALAAPTGKAAARLEEAVHAQAAALDIDETTRIALLDLSASTLHRLLGWRPDSQSRFRHNRDNHLPHDVVIVDETSMVSLSLMGRLVEAVRPDARLVLIGDPGQLTSIEAGAVLGDLVGPASDGPHMRSAALAALEEAIGRPIEGTAPPAGVTVGDGIVVLDRVHRFGGAIATLADAIRRGDGDAAIECLAGTTEDVEWLPLDVADADADGLTPIRDAAVQAGGAVLGAARAGDAAAALDALGAFRVLCAHRRGPYGAHHWMTAIQRWLADAIPDFDPWGDWYVGRPLLVTENDYSLKLYNGDTGVVVAAGQDRVAAAFERRGEVIEFSPTRLSAVDTVYAMTVHKSQGSQFGVAAVLLPPADSPILTRELLYTAVTRASGRLIVAGTEDTLRAAIARPAARASALRGRLWGAV